MTSPRRVLLTGAQGQLGRALQALAPEHWCVMACVRSQLDITHARQVRTCVQAFGPHVIINAAAYNAVDAAQKDEVGSSAAWRVNAQGPGSLAHAASSVGARLLHVSTDYVFDGRSNQPYDEHHPPNPLNRYGASKLAGEQAVLLEQPDALIVRTSWLFSELADDDLANTVRPNFIRNVITQLKQGQPLRVTSVQHSAPTYAGHLAAAIIRLLDMPNVAGGLYHYRDTPDLTRCDYARTIRQLWIETHALDADTVPPVQAITGADFKSVCANPAPRPAYSVLNCQRLTSLGIPPVPWLPALRRVIAKV